MEREDAIPHGASVISCVLGEFRTGYDLYATVRPIQALPGTNTLHENADLIIIRENTEGLYSRYGWIDRDYHMNLRIFTAKVMERLLRFAFEYAL
ncbi:MAG TPA: isocitrate/isopropylmalate family dehydrogenase [Anaerolineales bacterium]|nr:isocitrate/isopropylmalate family dehydrogenase [Anaerolineales bacterium]